MVVLTVETGETRTLVDGYQPAWSPDGSSIAFTRFGGEFMDEGSVFILDMKTGRESEVETENPAEAPQWSPSGSELVVTMRASEGTDFEMPELFGVPAAGGHPRRITEGGALYPSWGGH